MCIFLILKKPLMKVKVMFYGHLLILILFALAGGEVSIVNTTVFYNSVFLASLFWILESENKIKSITHTEVINTICLIADIAALLYLPLHHRYNMNDRVTHQIFTVLIIAYRPILSLMLYKEKLGFKEEMAQPENGGKRQQNMLHYSEIDFSARDKSADNPIATVHKSYQNEI